jgi:SHS2 domain-containing protein
MKSDDLKSKLQKAYQSMVDTIDVLVKKEGKTLREALENAEEKLSEWEELTKEEVHEISTEVKNDLQSIGETLEGAKQAYKKQLKMDTTYVTDSILEKLSQIADTPTAQFLLFKEQLEEQAQQAVTDEHNNEHNDHPH